jgi:predicted transcriptional regulator
MDSKALKFLLNLLSFPNYRALISHVKPTPKIKAAERNNICQELRDREWVACSEKIKTLKISIPGKALLKLGQAEGGLTLEEFQVLQGSSVGKITPNKIELPGGITAGDRVNLIENLAGRELLILEKEIDEVWLTDKGQKFLIEEYDPTDQSGTITFNLLADYLRLVRQFYPATAPGVINPPRNVSENYLPPSKLINQSANLSINELDILQTIRQLDIQLGALKSMSTEMSTKRPSDEDILQLISQLDRELGTENYLPIFHVREQLKYLFSREELDQVLYRLQANQQIQLKSLEEVIHYSPEYFEAAIPQEKAWSLFFIVRTYPSNDNIRVEDEDDRK